MKCFKTILELKNFLQSQKENTIGFVPTMGSLHKGHESLVQQSKKENKITIVSIYVNPKQFNDENDFMTYPRSLESDLAKLKKINCDVVFCPKTKEVYKKRQQNVVIKLGNLNQILEAKKRPGHFKGVIEIVSKLFEIISPDRAYFGEKDFQQLLIIKALANQKFREITIVPCRTIRDSNGLAKSSRNKTLNQKELNMAGSVYQLLCEIKKKISDWGVVKSKKHVQNYFKKNPEIKLDYFEIIEQESFSFTRHFSNTNNYRAMIAVQIGETRLIDNLKL